MFQEKEKAERLPPEVTLRVVTERDVTQYIELEKTRSSMKTYSSMIDEPEALEQIRKSKNYFILNDQGEVVGTVSYRIHSEGAAEIDGVLIKPDAEGRGFAKASLRQILEELKQYPKVYLMTHPDNHRSIPLYTSLGFVVTDRVENYFGDGEPRIKMELVRG